MHINNPKLVTTLKDAGYSVTAPRALVFAALVEIESPINMHDLVLKLHKLADRASVYRTMQLFEKLEIVQRLQQGFKHSFELSDLFAPHHHHIRCRQCGNLSELQAGNEIEAQLTTLAADTGYQNTSHLLELEGLCPACQRHSS